MSLSALRPRRFQQCKLCSVVTRSYATDSTNAKPIGSRWLSQTSSRIGKCMSFGLPDAKSQEAVALCDELACDWRELSAGSEGYLTGEGRRGLFKHKVVWGEQDSMGHVNNVVYVRYSESARVEWYGNFAKTIDPAHRKEWEELYTPRGIGLILGSIKTDFKFPMKYPDRVTVLHKLRSMPEPEHVSYILDVIMLSERHRRPVARCVEDIVMYDYRKGKKATLDQTPFMLDAFRETFRLQQEAAQNNRQRARMIGEQVRALETSSWDRDGAIEDMGSAKQ